MQEVTNLNDTVDTTPEDTEIVVRITPKQKLIAKVLAGLTAVAGIFALGYKLGTDDADDAIEDAYEAVDAANEALENSSD